MMFGRCRCSEGVYLFVYYFLGKWEREGFSISRRFSFYVLLVCISMSTVSTVLLVPCTIHRAVLGSIKPAINAHIITSNY